MALLGSLDPKLVNKNIPGLLVIPQDA